MDWIGILPDRLRALRQNFRESLRRPARRILLRSVMRLDNVRVEIRRLTIRPRTG